MMPWWDGIKSQKRGKWDFKCKSPKLSGSFLYLTNYFQKCIESSYVEGCRRKYFLKAGEPIYNYLLLSPRLYRVNIWGHFNPTPINRVNNDISYAYRQLWSGVRLWFGTCHWGWSNTEQLKVISSLMFCSMPSHAWLPRGISLLSNAGMRPCQLWNSSLQALLISTWSWVMTQWTLGTSCPLPSQLLQWATGRQRGWHRLVFWKDFISWATSGSRW